MSPDPIWLARRMRWLSPPSEPRSAGEGEVFEADVDQEGQPVADLLEDTDRDLVLLGAELFGQCPEPPWASRGERGRVADVGAGDLHRQGLGLEALAAARLAQGRAHEATDLLARPIAFGLLVAAFEIGDDALERLLHLVGAQAVVIGETDRLRAGPVEDDGPDLLGQVVPRVPVENL